MDARREPRFSIYGPVKVTLLSRPELLLDCVLLDVSATGLKLIATERLDVDEIISIEAEDHLSLADTRYSQPRGDKFTIGCERIHVLNKVSLPAEKSQVDHIKRLIDDYRNRIRLAIATERPDTNAADAAQLNRQILEKCGNAENARPAPSLSPTGPFVTREHLLDAAAAWEVGHWDKIPATPLDAPYGRSEIVDRLTVHLAEKLRPPMALQQGEKPQKMPKAPRQAVNVRRWRVPGGLAAAAILGWGLSAIFWSLGSSGAATHLQTSIAALFAPKESGPATPSSSERRALIKAVEPTWVIATVDGKRLFNKKFAKDDIREIEFSEKALLRIGNAKGVEIRLDGKPVGSIGGRGQTRLVELSANGCRLLPLR